MKMHPYTISSTVCCFELEWIFYEIIDQPCWELMVNNHGSLLNLPLFFSDGFPVVEYLGYHYIDFCC